MRERDGPHSLCCCFSCILCVYHPWAFQILGDVRDSHWSFLACVWNPRIQFLSLPVLYLNHISNKQSNDNHPLGVICL